jgi:hypothetical protein
MNYIGSHHGSLNDRYKGSNTRFLRAIKKRPFDFTRYILEYINVDDNKETLKYEQKWLDSITDIKSNSNYYNQKNEACGGWSFITNQHIDKRAATLREKHLNYGLSKEEIKSYKIKIEKRLHRIATTGFTDKEKEQHSKYGYKIKIIDLFGNESIFNSCGLASRALGIDVQYGLKVCKTKDSFKGFKCIKLRDPVIDCRS